MRYRTPAQLRAIEESEDATIAYNNRQYEEAKRRPLVVGWCQVCHRECTGDWCDRCLDDEARAER